MIYGVGHRESILRLVSNVAKFRDKYGRLKKAITRHTRLSRSYFRYLRAGNISLYFSTYTSSGRECRFSTKSASIGLGSGSEGTVPSESSRSKKLRSLEQKGAVRILERSHKGILVTAILPQNIPCLVKAKTELDIDIESLDFYKDRRLLTSILEREGYRCFYTGKKLTEENCYLDHLIAQSLGGNNSYKNIVATSYDANSLKNNKPIDDFIRELYKSDLISLTEFNELKKKIGNLQEGKLAPSKASIKSAILK